MGTSPDTTRSAAQPVRKAVAAALVLVMGIGSILMWLVVPVGWVYLGSQMASSSQPSMGPYVLIAVGIPASMVVIGKLLGRLNRAYADLTGVDNEVRIRTPWLKSLREDRAAARPRTILDVVMVVSVGLALLVFGVWFFFFAGSSLPRP